MNNSALPKAHTRIARTSAGNVTALAMACALLATAVQACGAGTPTEVEPRDATPPVEFQQRIPVTCIINPATNQPHGLDRSVQPREQQEDTILVSYIWKNDCPSSIRLYDIVVLVWDDPDRTGQNIGTLYLDDIDIGPMADAEIRGAVLLDDGYRAIHVEGPDNVVMNFNIRYANQ